MSSFQTSHSPDESQLTYKPTGYASIEIDISEDGVAIIANADGLRSLAKLFADMADRSTASCHIHLTPSVQLTPASLGLVVARVETGQLPEENPPSQM